MFGLPPTPQTLERQARYRLSQDFIHLLELVEIGLHGRRLALGLAHAICRETSNWQDGSARQPLEGYRVRCKLLRDRLGLEGAKGNRDLVKGIEELAAVRLLEGAELTCGRQWLEWRLTDYMFLRLFEPKPYGLFDIRHARHLVTPLDHLIYNRIGVIRRCVTPKVTFSVEGCAEILERKPDWARMRPAIVDALIRAARLFNVTLKVICECHGKSIGIDHVTIRVQHGGTNWSTTNLEKLPATARKVFLVDGNGCRETPD